VEGPSPDDIKIKRDHPNVPHLIHQKSFWNWLRNRRVLSASEEMEAGMSILQTNFQPTIFLANSAFCGAALFFLINSFFYDNQLNTFFIIERILLIILLSLNLCFCIKSFKTNDFEFISPISLILFLAAFSHQSFYIARLGFNDYFVILFEMLKQGYIYPHASIAFGSWNLFIYLFIRGSRKRTTVPTDRPDTL
jgi:hypothetical protein